MIIRNVNQITILNNNLFLYNGKIEARLAGAELAMAATINFTHLSLHVDLSSSLILSLLFPQSEYQSPRFQINRWISHNFASFFFLLHYS